MQTEGFVGVEEIFNEDYAYFSSYSASWVDHARCYVDAVVERFRLSTDSTVVEIAANDGYLLQFVKERNIRCYGIEPTQSTANAARAKGIEIITEFFGSDLATRLSKKGRQADLVVANNVLAHVPAIDDFVLSFSILLKPGALRPSNFRIYSISSGAPVRHDLP